MKFTIITPTHNRLELVKRCVNSVLAQSYSNWEMIIIDDSTDNATYNSNWRNNLDKRIKYIKNNKNMGANYSRNIGLDNATGDFIVFLDDDDIFTVKCLEEALFVIKTNSKHEWFISNRIYKNGIKITQISEYSKKKGGYSYVLDYLLGSQISGDCTHILSKRVVSNTRFPKDIKNGFEWEFWAEIGAKTKIFTYDYPSTICEYKEQGLTKTLDTSLFRIKQNWRMLKKLPKIEPRVSFLFLAVRFLVFLPPFFYVYIFYKKLRL